MRKIIASICVDQDAEDGLIEEDLLEVYFAFPKREDFQPYSQMIAGQKRRSAASRRAEREIVEVDLELAPVDQHSVEAELSSGDLCGFLNDFLRDKSVECLCLKDQVPAEKNDQDHDSEGPKRANNPFFPVHAPPTHLEGCEPGGPLECLAERDEVLSSFYAGHGIQVMANIEANRPDRCVVANAETHGVRVIVDHRREIDVSIHVASVVEEGSSQILDKSNRKSRLRIKDEESLASHRDTD